MCKLTKTVLVIASVGFLTITTALQAKPEITVMKGHSQSVQCVAFTPDGKYIVSGSGDGSLKLWDRATGKELRTYCGPIKVDYWNCINSISISPDGKFVIAAHDDNTLQLWDIVSGKLIRTFIGTKIVVNSVAFSPDGKTGVSGHGDNNVVLWDVATGVKLKTFAGHSLG